MVRVPAVTFLLRTVRGVLLLALALFVVLACRADEGLVGPVNLRAAPVDSVLEPGRPLHLHGIDLAGITVRIGGLNAKTLEATSTDLVVDVPDSLFAPCLRSGVRYDVELRRGRQRATVSMAASSIPYRVSLDPGEHVLATAAVSRGCSVEVADSGVYLAMPFAWDRDSAVTPTEEIRAQVTITPEHRPANRKLASRQHALPKRPSPLVDRPTSARLRQTYLPAVNPENDAWDTVLPVGTACAAAPAIGDSMLLATARARNGRFLGLHGPGRQPEYWRVVGSSAHLVVLFDRPALLKARSSGMAKQRLLTFLNDYESTIRPFFATTLPRWQRKERIPILMTDTSAAAARGYAYPGWNAGPGCDGKPATSDFIWLDGTALFRGTPVREARLLSTAAHETAHLSDFAREKYGSHGVQRREWTTEGYADVLRHLWVLNGQPHPFTSNLAVSPFTTTPEGARVYSLCGLAIDRPRPRAVSGAIDYPMACRMVSSLISHAVAAGQPEGRVLEEFSGLPSRQTFTQISNELSGESLTPNQAVGEWLLSWYADEMPGTSTSIQDPMWDLRRFFPSSALVDAYIASGGGVTSLVLDELDARYLQIQAGRNTRIAYTAPNGAPLATTQTDMALLRVR
ncbi:MAG: hypothetical protein ABI836_11565 [Gemmatimonadota bacterium]